MRTRCCGTLGHPLLRRDHLRVDERNAGIGSSRWHNFTLDNSALRGKGSTIGVLSSRFDCNNNIIIGEEETKLLQYVDDTKAVLSDTELAHAHFNSLK